MADTAGLRFHNRDIKLTCDSAKKRELPRCRYKIVLYIYALNFNLLRTTYRNTPGVFLSYAISFGVYMLLTTGCGATFGDNKTGKIAAGLPAKDSNTTGAAVIPLDTALYDSKWQQILKGDSLFNARVKNVYPLPGAVLPFKRIVAYYGNFYSKKMGILGELPEAEMLAKLKSEVEAWKKADSSMDVVPAIHYIAITAQGAPGKDKRYRLRMPFDQIDKALETAKKIDALVFIDIQVGLSNLEAEVPLLEKYLRMPNVHFGIDPEFSMKDSSLPGKKIGTFDAADINYVSGYLAKLVRESNLPPKVLIIHRFTQGMVTNYNKIQLRPEVQVVMDMDGWGGVPHKETTYKLFIKREPVQFTGFKLFYKNDFRQANSRIMTPEEVLKLKPQPVYIQYQ